MGVFSAFASLTFGCKVEVFQLIRNLAIFRAWEPAVSELRLAHRSRVENPFSTLPDKVLTKIEQNLWQVIDKKECTVSRPGKEAAYEFFEAAEKPTEEELKRLFDLSIVTYFAAGRGPMSNPVLSACLGPEARRCEHDRTNRRECEH
jgi:hypothetical protein